MRCDVMCDSQSGDMFGGILRMMYDYLGRNGFRVGAEFTEAMTLAKQRGIPLIFGDQNASQTMKNISANFKWTSLLPLIMNPAYQQKLMTVQSEMAKRLAEYHANHPDQRTRSFKSN